MDSSSLGKKKRLRQGLHTHTHTHTHKYTSLERRREGKGWEGKAMFLLRTWEGTRTRSSGSPAGGDGERAFSWDFFENLLLYFGCPGSALLCGLFPGCSEQGLLWSCSGWASCRGGFSCFKTQALGTWASVVAAPWLESAHSLVGVCGLSCSAAYGIFPNQGSTLCLLHWQVYSLPLSIRETPRKNLFYKYYKGWCIWSLLGFLRNVSKSFELLWNFSYLHLLLWPQNHNKLNLKDPDLIRVQKNQIR